MAKKPRSTKGITRLELRGADELHKTLLQIPREFRVWGLERAAKKAGRILTGPIRRATPVAKEESLSKFNRANNPPGTMRKSVRLVYRKYRSGLIQGAYIGHSWWHKGRAAHLVELGTKERFTTGKKSKKAGISSGAVRPRNFFKPVIDAHRNQVHATMRRELAASVTLAIEKARKKGLL